MVTFELKVWSWPFYMDIIVLNSEDLFLFLEAENFKYRGRLRGFRVWRIPYGEFLDGFPGI